jgi:hypothetical protein
MLDPLRTSFSRQVVWHKTKRVTLKVRQSGSSPLPPHSIRLFNVVKPPFHICVSLPQIAAGFRGEDGVCKVRSTVPACGEGS